MLKKAPTAAYGGLKNYEKARATARCLSGEIALPVRKLKVTEISERSTPSETHAFPKLTE
jgi:hypothetical protein